MSVGYAVFYFRERDLTYQGQGGESERALSVHDVQAKGIYLLLSIFCPNASLAVCVLHVVFLLELKQSSTMVYEPRIQYYREIAKF